MSTQSLCAVTMAAVTMASVTVAASDRAPRLRSNVGTFPLSGQAGLP